MVVPYPVVQAKDALCQKIDNYIRDRIIIADEVIQELAGKKINDGDVILTYARLVLFLSLDAAPISPLGPPSSRKF